MTCVHPQQGPWASIQSGWLRFGLFWTALFFCSLLHFIYLFMFMLGMWRRSEGNLWESVLDFHHGSSGNRTQVFSLGSKCLYELSPLACPALVFQK